MFRENEVIILIGAGCSRDAGIFTSKEMVHDLEKLLKNDGEWRKYEFLYNCVKSSILYSDGIIGKYEDNFDIERLVNVLGELEKKENCILYPFIGSWNPRLLEIAGHGFDLIKQFKLEILRQLQKWVTLDNYKDAQYYERFFDFQSEYDYTLRVFSLNYDLCFERNIPQNKDKKDLERGFDPDTNTWDWVRFERKEEFEPSLYLYKLHGSIDWKRSVEEGNVLKQIHRTPDIPDLIFGTDYKMQYIDPYLFYAYELRKYSLVCKVILAVGYGFRDEHINGILGQALQNQRDRKIVIVSPDANDLARRFAAISKIPEINGQLISVRRTANDFLNGLSIDELTKLLSEKSAIN